VGKAVAVTPAVAVAEAPVEVSVPKGITFGSNIEDPEKVEDPGLEWKLCLGAVPAMLALALLFHSFPLGHFLQRTWLTMPVHEMGHAVSAWFCGFAAMPTLWFTSVAEERGFGTVALLLGLLGYMTFRAWKAEKYVLVALGGSLLVVQAVCTLGLKAKTAEMLIVWGGDGVGMILAAALMASFFFGKGSDLYRGGLRWGFLAIGSAAFVDIFSQWFAARRDSGKIPFGEQEGRAQSDATRLVDDFDWTADQMVRRYVVLGVVCLIVFLAVWAWGTWRAWREAQEKA